MGGQRACVLKWRGLSLAGVAADVDDEHIVPAPTSTIYETFADSPLFGGHLFIHTTTNPYSLVTPVTKIIRQMSADEPVENAATLEDIRAKVLAPDRLNSLVFGVFAAVALIAVVGVAGVLAFSVSARTREFGIRLALGSQPESLTQRCSRGRRRGGCRWRSGGRGVRVRRCACGRQLFRRLKNAGRIARDRFCVCAVRRGGSRFDAPGGTRRPRRSSYKRFARNDFPSAPRSDSISSDATILVLGRRALACDPRKNALLKAGNKSDRIDAHKLSELL